MKRKFQFISLFCVLSVFVLTGCAKDGAPGPAGQDATVYYSEWFPTTEWFGQSGDWYFTADAPDLTQDIVEGGVILAYVSLADDLYGGNAVRPLPAFAVGANWSFLIPDYGAIEFTCDMINTPGTTGNLFRFIAIPGTVSALKSSPAAQYSEKELREMPYKNLCQLLGIKE